MKDERSHSKFCIFCTRKLKKDTSFFRWKNYKGTFRIPSTTWRDPDCSHFEKFFNENIGEMTCNWCVKIWSRSKYKIVNELRLPPKPEYSDWFHFLYRLFKKEEFNEIFMIDMMIGGFDLVVKKHIKQENMRSV